MEIYVQGDVILKSIDKVKGKKMAGDLLWKGVNNHHRVKGKFSIKKDSDTIYLESNGCTLFHEEHENLKIPKGKYVLHIALERDHLLEESRQVID